MIFGTRKVRSFLAVGCLAASFLGAADTQPPLVTVTHPAPGATLTGKYVVTVTATDPSGIANVSLKIDGVAVSRPVDVSPFAFVVETSKLANGMHSLHAVATDRAHNTARSSIISITVTNPLSYTIGAGPFVVENLGSVLAANTQDRQAMFRLANGDLHLLLYYDVPELWLFPFQILDVNLSRGTAILTNGVLGRPGTYATSLHTNGMIYLASNDPGYLMQYDPSNGSTQEIAKLSQKAAHVTQIGDDGWLYIGECCLGGVERYNPNTKVFENLGRMDDSGPAYQYAYTIGADTRYIYAGLGEAPWYLAIYDRQTGNKTNYWKGQHDSGGAVYRGQTGGWYYLRSTTNGNRYYKLEGAEPTLIAAASVPTLIPWYQQHDGVVSDPTQFKTKFGVEVDLGDIFPDSTRNTAIVKWRQLGNTNWQMIEVSGFFLRPINIKRLYPGIGAQLFGFADFYGPVFLYDPVQNSTKALGRPQVSLYDGLFEANRVYLSGYSAATLEYDPNKAWTLKGTPTNQASPDINPKRLIAGFGKYHYYSALGADGMLYCGAHHERDSTGGELGWYDPLTRTNGSLRQPFLSHDVRDLKPALGGTKIVYSSDNEKLFVLDVASKQIERIIIPVPGIGSLDKIIEVSPGIVLGAAGNRIFKVDIRDGSILYTNTLHGPAFGGAAISNSDRRLTLGPDGFVWMFIGNSLYRVNPGDCSLSKILDTPAKTILFKGIDLYLYGGPNLYRIRGALHSTLPNSPSGLRVLAPQP